MRRKLCIFDLDGTLLDTLDDIKNSMNRVLRANGFPGYDGDWYRRALGLGAGAILRAGIEEAKIAVDEARLADMFRHFQEDQEAHGADLTKPYDGIPELLDRLGERSVKLAIISNKPEGIVRELARKYFEGAGFEAIYGDADGKPLKPDPHAARVVLSQTGVSAGEAVYVGDTEFDMIFAERAGLFGIGVLWGFRERGVLEESGAKALVEAPAGILEYL